MIIGFDGSRAFNKNRTGTENYSYQLLLHLAKIDIENHYLVYIRPGSSVNSNNWPDNFKFITIPFPRLWTQAGLALQTFKDHLDVLFIPSHTLPLIHKPGLTTILTVHDLGAEYLPTMHQLKQRLYLKLMTDYQIKSASHLIAVSNATKQDLIKKVGVPKNKISVVYEGFNKELFEAVSSSKQKEVLIKYGLEENNYFLFVGTIQPRKNLERLIRAYSQFLDTRGPAASDLLIFRSSDLPVLVLVGSKGWLSDEIYELPKRLGVENQVKFLGYVPDKDLPALYSNAIAFTFPSLFEGFGLPILEAFANHCPVLTSNISSMPEVAGDAALLVDPYLVESISQGLEKLHQNPTLRNNLVKLGLKQIQKFSWEKAARETLEILTKTD